jgi:type II secretory pathway pseudopilin PulG
VSLPELLVVIAILALGVMVSIPMIADRVHLAKAQSAVGQYAVTLRAARMIAVSKQTPVTVTVRVHPDNFYEYNDAMGRLRTTRLPAGVWFDDTESTGDLVFSPDGSLAAVSKTVIQSTMFDGAVREWVVDVPFSGIPVIRP